MANQPRLRQKNLKKRSHFQGEIHLVKGADINGVLMDLRKHGVTVGTPTPAKQAKGSSQSHPQKLHGQQGSTS